jgi:hypothetical protein
MNGDDAHRDFSAVFGVLDRFGYVFSLLLLIMAGLIFL